MSPGTYYGRGRCYELMDDRTRAIADYRKTLEVPARDAYQRSAHDKARERLAALGEVLDPQTPNADAPAK
jgi:hypothetical protein